MDWVRGRDVQRLWHILDISDPAAACVLEIADGPGISPLIPIFRHDPQPPFSCCEFVIHSKRVRPCPSASVLS